MEKEKILTEFPLYHINTDGRIYSSITHKYLKPQLSGKKGKQYLKVYLKRRNGNCQRSVHRLVAQTFIENPKNLRTVNHKDFDRLNNSVSNLEWASYEENERHKLGAGRGNHSNGANHTKALRVFQYSQDKSTLIAEFDCIMDAARKLNIPNSNSISIIRVCKGKRKTAYNYFWSYIKL